MCRRPRSPPEPARGQLDLGFRVLVWADPRRGERRSVPVRFEHGAEVVGVLFGEVAGIADADDASRRVMPEDEGGKGDRGRNGRLRAGRSIEALYLWLSEPGSVEPSA